LKFNQNDLTYRNSELPELQCFEVVPLNPFLQNQRKNPETLRKLAVEDCLKTKQEEASGSN
jgi:hypothetical protein